MAVFLLIIQYPNTSITSITTAGTRCNHYIIHLRQIMLKIDNVFFCFVFIQPNQNLVVHIVLSIKFFETLSTLIYIFVICIV